MINITVERDLKAAPDAVFEALTNHADYNKMPSVLDASLVRLGKEEPNGTGARRRLWVGPAVIEEDITHFDRPHSYGYTITRMLPSLLHDQQATVSLTPTDTGTKVVYTAQFRNKTPVVGKLIEKKLEQDLTKGFHQMLKAAERMAQAAQ